MASNEELNDGYLRRLYHDDSQVSQKISKVEGTEYRVQRVKQKEGGAYIEPVAIVCRSWYVSTYHCLIFRKNSTYWIRDLKSTNGTYLNGQMLPPITDTQLRFGDKIGIGLSHDKNDNRMWGGPDCTQDCFYIFIFTMFQEEENQ